MGGFRLPGTDWWTVDDQPTSYCGGLKTTGENSSDRCSKPKPQGHQERKQEAWKKQGLKNKKDAGSVSNSDASSNRSTRDHDLQTEERVAPTDPRNNIKDLCPQCHCSRNTGNPSFYSPLITMYLPGKYMVIHSIFLCNCHQYKKVNTRKL